MYYGNNLLLLGSWVYLRLLYSPYFLIAHMGPSCPLNSPLATFAFAGYMTYTLMIFMSAVWLMQLLKNGVQAFLVLGDPSNLQNKAVIKFGARREGSPTFAGPQHMPAVADK